MIKDMQSLAESFSEEAKAISECVSVLSCLSGGVLACDRVVRVLNNMIADRAIIERTQRLIEADEAQAELTKLIEEQKAARSLDTTEDIR